MTFPTLADFNTYVDLLSVYLTLVVEDLNSFMSSTQPYIYTCARKKLLFLLFFETTIVFAFLYETRRAKYLAFAYLPFKIAALTTHTTLLSGYWLFTAWVVIIATAIIDIIVVNFAIICLTWGNEKGKRIWMRVTPKRKMLEAVAAVIYNSVKILLLTNNYCRKWFTESDRWETMEAAYSWHIHRYLKKGHYSWQPIWERDHWEFFYTKFRYIRKMRKHYQQDPRFNIYAERVNSSFFWGDIWPDFADARNLVELDSVSNLRYGILFILALSSLTVYSIILAGWSSNSKYAFLGALRSAAQMISYEVSISLALLPVILLSGSLNLTEIVFSQSNTLWYIFPLLPVALIFLVSMLAETNRTPFDLPEAEAELVAGYNVDYSSLPFAMFFLGEYANMILISVFFCLLFLGGWEFMGITSFTPFILALKASVPWIFFVLVRATLPRYRYDQLMDIGWKAFLPVTGAFLVLVIGLVTFLDVAPVVEEFPL